MLCQQKAIGTKLYDSVILIIEYFVTCSLYYTFWNDFNLPRVFIKLIPKVWKWDDFNFFDIFNKISHNQCILLVYKVYVKIVLENHGLNCFGFAENSKILATLDIMVKWFNG